MYLKKESSNIIITALSVDHLTGTALRSPHTTNYRIEVFINIMASVARFQLALNADDASLIYNELELFKNAMLQEHLAEKGFGYHGRTFAPLSDQHPPQIVGVLLEYSISSPQMEELFLLWNVSGRDENRSLAALQVNIDFCYILLLINNEK